MSVGLSDLRRLLAGGIHEITRKSVEAFHQAEPRSEHRNKQHTLSRSPHLDEVG